MAGYTEEAVFAAPRHVVYDVFADRERSGEYLPFRTRLVRHGHTERQGVGAIHLIGVGPLGVREEITELVPDEHIRYRVVSGLPVRSHIGTISFADHPAGTAVKYRMESTPRVPVSSAVLVAILRRSTRTMVDGARQESLRRAEAMGWHA